MDLQINSGRIAAELNQLATFSDAPEPAVTRVVFTPVDLKAREYIKDLSKAARLDIREDAVGNLFARWAGTDANAPAVATGSHIDAIPHSGRYDGTVGVIAGLEAIRGLQASGFRPRRSIELLMFTSEEPTRFGIGCLGSRLLAGVLDASCGRVLRDKDGITVDEARTAAGFGGDLNAVRLNPGCYSAFVELHIEQGPLLERQNIAVGIVTSIAAPASLRISIEGEGGHAGAVLMPYRHDAFLAAAEIALAVEQAAKDTGAIDTVATCGVCQVFPGAVNSIPSRATLEIDVRDIERARRDDVLANIKSAVEEVATRRGVRIRQEIINADNPARCDAGILTALVEAANANRISYQEMVSRAYHDSLFMAQIVPTAMLFIPCRNGWSHRPDEYASVEDIARGATVLAHALAALSV